MPRSKEAKRDYTYAYRDRVREFCYNRLGGVCVVCGTTDNLQFDHIDPFSKLFTIGSNLTRRRSELLDEVDKCQLLCKAHHDEKTRQEGGPKTGPDKNGQKPWLWKFSAETVLVWAALHEEGVSLKEIGRRYDTSSTQVGNRLRKLRTNQG